jgi:hypothetical protein
MNENSSSIRSTDLAATFEVCMNRKCELYWCLLPDVCNHAEHLRLRGKCSEAAS